MTFLRSRGLVAWLGFSLLREELRSNSTKQSSKNSDLQNFFYYFFWIATSLRSSQ
ncbi:hypothetical protein [Rickettsia felis]|uniref:hypothetical protein n=1 Tax=Rickettsia felis TaxID=42862 RepID=UPI0015852775|nr:hypothetical protein [Rickettsia felis]